MMIDLRHHGRLGGLDDRGVALPIALFGLIAVSLLVTSALITSSTELAISGGHQDATRALYAAEEGMERYLASVDVTLADGGSVPPCTNCDIALANGEMAIVNVVRLDSVGPAGANPAYEIYCATSRASQGGGREIGTLFRVNISSSDTLAFDIQAAASFGEDIRLQGSAKLYGRQTNVSRCSNQELVAALQYSTDADFDVNGSVDLQGDTVQTAEDKWQMQDRILNGLTPAEMAENADIAFDSDTPFDSNYNGKKAPHSDNPVGSPYNWGCPGTMVSCDPVGKPNQDTTYYPVVDIDAAGGEIELSGSNHGQGILLIRNGSLKITGTFDYKGVIIVEGALDIAGSAKIDGAVVATGVVTIGDNENDLAGSMEINYDPCVIGKAQEAFNENGGGSSGTRSLAGGSFAWFEVIR